MKHKLVFQGVPGRPGSVRIHYFVHDEAGPIEMPSDMAMTAFGPITLGGSKGRIACQPTLKVEDVLPKLKGGFTHLFQHSDEARAVTCPDCCRSDDYKSTMQALDDLEKTKR